MFFRLIAGAFRRQWKKMLLIALTIALGASIATAMLNVMLDVGDKINEELKAYGANITVMSQQASVLSNLYELDDEDFDENMYLKEEVVGELLTIFWANNIRDFNPSNETKVTYNGSSIKVVGSWFNHHLAYTNKGTVYERDTGIINLRSWWEIVDGEWMNEQSENDDLLAMVGEDFAKENNVKVGDYITLVGKSSTENVKVVGIYSSGDDEDSYVYTTLSCEQRLSGTSGYVKTISISAITSPDDDLSEKAVKNPQDLTMAEYDLWYCTAYVSSICYQIQEAIPEASATAIRQVADSEGDILNKTQLLMTLITILSLIGAALGISNLVTSSVMERSQELGLLKAIGAKGWQITVLVLTEIGITALVGGVAGYFMGFGFAQIIGQTVFGAAIEMKGIVAFLVALLILAVSALGSLPAIRMVLKLRPSEVLHGR